MKRYTCLLLLFAAVPTYAQELVIPDKVEAKVGRLTPIKIDSSYASTLWKITPENGDVDVFREYDPSSKSTLLRMIAYRDGSYTLVVAAASGDKQIMRSCVITVGTPPAPVPPAPVPSGKIAKSLTFVVFAPTPATAIITEDADFRKWLSDNGVAVYGVTTQEQLASIPKFAGVVQPCIVLQDTSNDVIGSLSLAGLTPDAARAYVLRFKGGK